jgi:hypothetical protein
VLDERRVKMFRFGEEAIYLLSFGTLMAEEVPEQTSERIPMSIVDFGTLLC